MAMVVAVAIVAIRRTIFAVMLIASTTTIAISIAMAMELSIIMAYY